MPKRTGYKMFADRQVDGPEARRTLILYDIPNVTRLGRSDQAPFDAASDPPELLGIPYPGRCLG